MHRYETNGNGNREGNVMKIQTKAYGLGGIKNVHMVDFGTTKKVCFEVWEYENGYMSFPSNFKFTDSAKNAVLGAIKSYVHKMALCS